MAQASHQPTSFDVDSEVEHVERVDTRDRRLGRYRLVYQLASGGMATVYLGRAEGPAGVQRAVAIKRIHPHLARRKQFVAMFLDEARIASRINHPNVCSLFDFGEADGTYYMAMEYMMGAPLTRLIRQVSRSPARQASGRWHAFACRIVADAAEGLHSAHELRDDDGLPLGIVHRDVSPQNVFVTYDGAVKVVDFGIALARNRLSQTNTGTLKGKFGYMAPEHASGGDVDRRADVWSLGVCLWEMLVGARLFRRKNDMDTLLAVRNADIEPPSTFAFGVPGAMDRVVMRALERDPERRYPTARDMSRELMEAVRESGEPTGLGDLAEWMQPLFAESQSEQIELVRTVLESQIVETGTSRGGERVASTAERRGRRRRRKSGPWRAVVAVAGAAALIAVGVVMGNALSSNGTEGPAGEPASSALPAEEGPAALAPPSAPEPAEGPSDERDRATGAPEEPVAGDHVPPPEPEPATANEGDDTAEPTEQRERARAVRRPRRQAAPEPAAFGHADVVAIGGWAEVYANGRRLGRTPTRVRLRAGRQVLTLRPFGDGPAKRVPVDVPADGVARVTVPLSSP